MCADRSALFLHTEITKFRIFFAFFYILDHVTSASHTPTTRRRYRPSTRRRTPKIYRDLLSLSELIRSLSFPYPSQPQDITEHHRGRAPNYQNTSEIVAQPRKASETFGSSIYSSDNCYILIYFTFRHFLLYRFLTNFIIIDLAFSLCFPFQDLLKIVV